MVGVLERHRQLINPFQSKAQDYSANALRFVMFTAKTHSDLPEPTEAPEPTADKQRKRKTKKTRKPKKSKKPSEVEPERTVKDAFAESGKIPNFSPRSS